MKRRLSGQNTGWAMVVAIAALALVCGPFADRASAQGGLTTWLLADANKRFDISGVVESVNYVTNNVHLNANGQSVDIAITPTTAIEVRGETGSISDIRHGSKITATGVIRNGVWVANSVVIH
jgi:hypothetical protein